MRFIIFFLFVTFSQNIFSQKSIINYAKDNFKISPTEVIIYADSIFFNNKSLNKDSLAHLAYYQALAYQISSNNKKAIEKLNLINFSEQNNNLKVRILLAKTSSNISLQNYTLAANQSLFALEITKEFKLENLKSKALNSLSYVHYSIKEYEKSLFYLQESVDFYIETKDSLELSATYNNMAILYKNIGNFQKSIDLNYKALEISKLINDDIGVGKSYSNIGRVYDLLGDQNKALVFYQKADKHNKEKDISNSIPVRNMADFYFDNNQLEKAEKKYLEAVRIESTKDNDDIKYNLYSNLLRLVVKTNDFEKALYYQNKVDSFSRLKSEFENEKSIRNIETQYKLQSSKKKLIQQEKDNNKNKIIFIVILIGLILFALFIHQRNRSIKLKLSEEKLMLEQQVLRSQMNPHFIFNALSAIQNSLLDNQPIQSASYLSKFAKLIRQNFDFINKRKILLSEEIDALQNYMDTQKMRFKDKFSYEINVAENVDINDTKIPPLLLQPFIENAIEHGFKNLNKAGLVKINISRNLNSICYNITDNGIGYDVKQTKDNKEHAIDVFKKRMKLLENNDFNTFNISSSDKGTSIKFCLKE